MTHFFICVHLKDDNYGTEEVQNLRSLVLNLRQLLDLHQKYNCRLSLSVFEKVFPFMTHLKPTFEHHVTCFLVIMCRIRKHLNNDLNPNINALCGDNVVLQGSVRSVAFFMLDKVPAPELIAATVESSILPYAEEHEIPFDELLLQYIQVKFPLL